jgi:cytochrome c oxidase subunit 2
MQHSLLVFFAILSVVITAVFIFVYQSSLSASEENQGMKNTLQKRGWFLLILVVVLAMFASITIPKSPYFVYAKDIPSKVIHVAAGQFYFMMSYNAIDPKNPSSDPSIEVPVNQVVEFRVTSLDVNHNFGIYDSNNVLIAQTQAMPGYVNRLRCKFTKPGDYNVFCLEFCGSGHQIMRSSFTVK